AERPAAKPRRAGFKEKRELAELPARIERLEAERQRLFDELASPALYAGRGEQVAARKADLATTERDLEAAYARWLELESLASGEGE
ncbi:MAG TPA: ABC transporter ATP-binding protein, partial [Candidatus Eisenbacteria bacterium]